MISNADPANADMVDVILRRLDIQVTIFVKETNFRFPFTPFDKLRTGFDTSA
jgi:hypothetical protein